MGHGERNVRKADDRLLRGLFEHKVEPDLIVIRVDAVVRDGDLISVRVLNRDAQISGKDESSGERNAFAIGIVQIRAHKLRLIDRDAGCIVRLVGCRRIVGAPAQLSVIDAPGVFDGDRCAVQRRHCLGRK